MQLRGIRALVIGQTKEIVEIFVHDIRWTEENRGRDEGITLFEEKIRLVLQPGGENEPERDFPSVGLSPASRSTGVE